MEGLLFEPIVVTLKNGFIFYLNPFILRSRFFEIFSLFKKVLVRHNYRPVHLNSILALNCARPAPRIIKSIWNFFAICIWKSLIVIDPLRGQTMCFIQKLFICDLMQIRKFK